MFEGGADNISWGKITIAIIVIYILARFVMPDLFSYLFGTEHSHSYTAGDKRTGSASAW